MHNILYMLTSSIHTLQKLLNKIHKNLPVKLNELSFILDLGHWNKLNWVVSVGTFIIESLFLTHRFLL